MRQRNTQQVDDHVLARCLEQLDHRVGIGIAVGIAQCHRAFERLVVAFGVDNTELIALRGQALQHGGCQSRFAGARRAGKQEVDAIGRDSYLCALLIHARAKQEMVACYAWLERSQVVAINHSDQLGHTSSVIATCDIVGALLDHRQGVGHRD